MFQSRQINTKSGIIGSSSAMSPAKTITTPIVNRQVNGGDLSKYVNEQNNLNLPLFMSILVMAIALTVVVILVAVMMNRKSSYQKSGYQVPRFSQEFAAWNPRGYQMPSVSQEGTVVSPSVGQVVETPITEAIEKLDSTATAIVPSEKEITKIPESYVSPAVPRITYGRKI